LVFFGAGFFSVFNFGFGALLLVGSLFFAYGGGGGRIPRFCFHLALGDLAAPHRFGDQLIGQHQPCICDVFHHQHYVGIFARTYVMTM